MEDKKTFQVDERGFYGEFGGAYIPEILYGTVENLKNCYLEILESEEFQKEYIELLRDYVGRPSPLYYARRMSEKYGCRLYLKREDLNHTGAHKINNTIGQILMAKKMGKKRIIAETGAGQHGVATATVCALMDMPCVVYHGALDVERQHTNVERMKMLGASAPRNQRQPDTERRHERGHTRLVLPSAGHFLHNRFNSRASSLPRHGGPSTEHHIKGDKGTTAG